MARISRQRLHLGENIPALVKAGFRVVVRFLRGYPPTETPADNRFDRATLALDVKGIIEALTDEPAFLVGQDWGAAITYGVLAAFPEIVTRAVVMAIPHPAMVRLSLNAPAHPDALKSASAYYRNMLQTSNAAAKLSEIIEKMNRPISVPTLVICGAEDIRGEVLAA